MSNCDWVESTMMRRPVPGDLFAYLRCSVCWGHPRDHRIDRSGPKVRLIHLPLN